MLVLDVMMPAKDGLTVLREMRAEGLKESTRVLLVTALTREEDWLRGYRLGADRYVTKPFEVNELVAAVDFLLTSRPEAIERRRREELEKAHILSRLESALDDL